MTTAWGSPSGRSGLLASEIALAAVSVGFVLSTARLFSSGDHLGAVLLCAVAAHLVPTLLRRRGLGTPLSLAMTAVTAAIVVANIAAPAETRFLLPTPAAFGAAAAELDTAFDPFRTLVAPVEADPGFVIADRKSTRLNSSHT